MRKAIQSVLDKELSPMQRMLCGNLAQKIEEAIESRRRMDHCLATALVAKGCTVQVICEGEELCEFTDNVDELVESIRSVDDCELLVRPHPRSEYHGWIMFTNWNDDDESICDYTCSDQSQFLVAIIEQDLPNIYQYPT